MINIEIGGYIELSQFTGEILHNEAVALNSARNCLGYLIETKEIKKIVLPRFLCSSIEDICKRYQVPFRYYTINEDFLPQKIDLFEDEWLYLVNYYGQIGNEEIKKIKGKYENLIIDNVQAYFQKPVNGVDTIYTCRKYFGVPDGAFLYTDKYISRTLEQDYSADRMKHLLGRYETLAKEYYSDYKKNESDFDNLPLRYMSRLTTNLLRGIDYKTVKIIRERNYLFLDRVFSAINQLTLTIPDGPFMYPLYVQNGEKIRIKLQEQGIYISTLWPDVFNICAPQDVEYRMAKNILPLPCDQRYSIKHMKLMADAIKKLI